MEEAVEPSSDLLKRTGVGDLFTVFRDPGLEANKQKEGRLHLPNHKPLVKPSDRKRCGISTQPEKVP